jgi:hypothetical protein
MTSSFSWKRFWVPRGIDWPEDEGFLLDPESELASYQSNLPVQLSAVRAKPVLILLGEAGAGKSTSIDEEYKHAKHIANEQGHLCAFLDLGEYSQETRLIHEIFESDWFIAYRAGTKPLALFLDSFDECKLGIPNLSRLLESQFKKHIRTPETLLIRIACRSADWSQSLESSLKDIWGDKDGDKVGVFELCPLREQDVAAKAQVMGLDGKVILQAIHEREVESLASHPKTLDYLLKEFAHNKVLPQRKAQIFEKGIQHLCEEHQRRIDSGRGGTLSPGARMSIAGRIAAALIFGNRTAVWRGSVIEKPSEAVTLEELLGEESDDITIFMVGTRALTETLTVAGLFRQRSLQELRFVHQSDAEFLAAWYLAKSGLDIKQMLMLLRHPHDGHIAPQLHQTASWLASLNNTVFQNILDVEPDILLGGDVASTENKHKERLVASLLQHYQQGKRYDWIAHHLLRKLSYPGLKNQLRPYVTDNRKRERVRRLAIEMVNACQVPSLSGVLADIALNTKQPLRLRIEAAEAIAVVGNTKVKKKLLPLAYCKAGEDPDDQLRGAALEALWPEHLTIAELFKALTPQHNKRFIGSYSQFIRHTLPNTLRPEHLPEALRWVEAQSPRWEMDYMLQDLIDDIMGLAWEQLEMPGVLDTFSSTALALLKRHDGLFNKRGRHDEVDMFADVRKRRMLLERMIPLVRRKDSYFLGWHIARDDDVPWLLERYLASPPAHERRILAELLACLVRLHSPHTVVNTLLDISGCHAQNPDRILRRVLRHLILPIRLKSKKAKDLRKHWQFELQQKQLRNTRKALPYTRAQYVAKRLEELEQGNIDAWIGLLHYLTLDEKNQMFHFPSGGATETTGWKEADATTSDRIVSGALQYLDQAQPLIKGYLTGDQHTKLGDSAAYVALELLSEVAPNQVRVRAESLAKKWAEVIVVNPNFRSGQTHAQLLQYVAHYAEKQMLTVIDCLLDREGKNEHGFLNAHDYDSIWSDRLAKIILDKARLTKFHEKVRIRLFNFLVQHGCSEAIAYLRTQATKTSKKPNALLFAFRLLCAGVPLESWDIISDLMHSKVALAKKVMLHVADDLGGNLGPFADLGEGHIVDLYIWLVRYFPHYEDPKHDDAYSPTARDHVANFRGSLLTNLAERGTTESCAALQRIVETFPKHEWLKWMLQNAQRKTRMATWQAPAVRDIFALTKDSRSRLIRSESEMLEAILESLQRFQQELSGETPIAPFLWEEITHKPKNENRLSDFVKQHLTKDLNRRGIIVNREVEIYNWPGRGRGDSTDMLIQAISPEKEVLTVVLETKGCWNRELLTAMDTQLKQKYLLGANHRCGIYLAGWFGDRYCKRRGFKELSRILVQQAKRLSLDGIMIKACTLDGSLKIDNKTHTQCRKTKAIPTRTQRH